MAKSRVSSLLCFSCGRHHGMFVVTDLLWKTVITGAYDRRGHICIGCFEHRMLKKIGRGLRIGDFKDVPNNDVVYHTYVMGVTHGEKIDYQPKSG